MGKVSTNTISLRYSIESAVGTAGTSWRILEPNEPSTYGQQIGTTPRRPISRTRGRRKGLPTSATSDVEFGADLTMDSLADFMEGFMFSEFANVEFDLVHPKANGAALAVTSTGYAVAGAAQVSTLTNGSLIASKLVYNASGAISLLYAKGYATAANNGLKVLDADVTGTSTEFTTAGLTAEASPPSNASVRIAGVRVTDADLTLTVTGSYPSATATLVSGADVSNWATLGIQKGMWIHIGSGDTSGAVQNALNASATDDTFGYARVVSVSGATLNLDKLDINLAATADNSGEGVADVMFGRFCRNVPVDSASDDDRYLERTYHFEMSYPNLEAGPATGYEYANGNYANELSIESPSEDKVVGTWGFLGISTEDITTTRKTGASTAVETLRSAGLSTATNIAAISTDVISSASDVCFNNLTLSMKNNASREVCLGKLGPSSINVGLFEVSMEGEMVFTSSQIIDAVASNTTVTFHNIFYNEDGAAVFDIPSLTFGDGSRSFPQDESVKVSITGESFTDPDYGYDMAVSLFDGTPSIRPEA
jgi:hypothetical protein